MGEIRREERFAFAVAERVLGATVDPYDIEGRQGAVDAMVRYPDGRLAALEVSSVGPYDEARILGFLSARGHSKDIAGLTRCWIVELPQSFHPADMTGIERALLRCESLGLDDLCEKSGLARDLDALRSQGVRAFAAGAADRGIEDVPRAYFMLPPLGGFTTAGAASLPSELAVLLDGALMRSKVGKLAATGLPERHLVLVVRPTAFTFAAFDSLAFGGPLPADVPCLPPGLTQVWLITGIRAGGVVRAITGVGWTRDDPYDDPSPIMVA